MGSATFVRNCWRCFGHMLSISRSDLCSIERGGVWHSAAPFGAESRARPRWKSVDIFFEPPVRGATRHAVSTADPTGCGAHTVRGA